MLFYLIFLYIFIIYIKILLIIVQDFEYLRLRYNNKIFIKTIL